MIKILILTPFFPPNIGGAETFTEQLAKEAAKENHVTVLTFMPFKGEAESYEEDSGIEILRIKWGLGHKTAWKGITIRNFLSVFPKLLWYARMIHKEDKFDIIHAQGLISGLVGAIIKGKAKLMITLLALYGFRFEQRRIFERVAGYIFNKSDMIFVEGYEGHKDICGLVKHKRIKEFKHWCDHDKFRNKKRTVEKIRILFIGRAIPEKGMDIVKGCERVLNDPNLEFEYVTEAKFEDLPEIYRRNHILCVPSIYSEGHVRVVIEGASSGCAIMTSDRGSLHEQVKDFGFCSAVENFPENLRYVIDNWESYSDRAFQYAKINFSKNNARTFLNEYRH